MQVFPYMLKYNTELAHAVQNAGIGVEVGEAEEIGILLYAVLLE